MELDCNCYMGEETRLQVQVDIFSKYGGFDIGYVLSTVENQVQQTQPLLRDYRTEASLAFLSTATAITLEKQSSDICGEPAFISVSPFRTSASVHVGNRT